MGCEDLRGTSQAGPGESNSEQAEDMRELQHLSAEQRVNDQSRADKEKLMKQVC